MRERLRGVALSLYERLLERELSGAPEHIAVIQDGNRRYADDRDREPTDGHRAGARTTEAMLDWCAELGVRELTLYAFSTENFERPVEEREQLFDLIEDKLYQFADEERTHREEVQIRAIGQLERLPERVREAVDYAESRTAEYDRFRLNVALAYGGRAELLEAARAVARDVEAGELDPADVDAADIESRLGERSARDVDLIVRTGGDERTSNFLPWHANGNEAAVYFCAPYWPEFRRVDFLRAVRTYESRRESWRQSRAERAAALVRALGPDAGLVGRLRRKVGELPEAVETTNGPGPDPEPDPEPTAD
jgi:tritrans,polycis-undecaprenyl-diphosphate synthase [geranylgeranyl-diphosphate specific]